MDGWFYSKRASYSAEDIGADFIWILITSTKGFYSAKVEIFMREWPGGSQLVFNIQPNLTSEIPKIYVGYK